MCSCFCVKRDLSYSRICGIFIVFEEKKTCKLQVRVCIFDCTENLRVQVFPLWRNSRARFVWIRLKKIFSSSREYPVTNFLILINTLNLFSLTSMSYCLILIVSLTERKSMVAWNLDFCLRKRKVAQLVMTLLNKLLGLTPLVVFQFIWIRIQNFYLIRRTFAYFKFS